MGLHLNIYASDRVSLDTLRLWANYRAYDIVRLPTPEEGLATDEVGSEMERLQRTPGHHYECPLVGLGPWEFLLLDPQPLTQTLVDKAKAEGRAYNILCRGTRYASHDFSCDGVVQFLESHADTGKIVWADGDF